MYKLSLLFLSIFISLQVTALTCQDLFLVSQQTKFAQKEIPFVFDGQFKNQLEALDQIQKKLQDLLTQISYSNLPEHFQFALAYSRDQNIHIASNHLNSSQHLRLVAALKDAGADQLLAQIPYFLRNKYFEVIVSEVSDKPRIKIAYKFARDLVFPVDSQFLTGFAQTNTNTIRKYDPANRLPDDRVIKTLQNQNIIQDTLATCGLASVCKILAKRNILFEEAKILEIAQTLGIKSLSEILGENPGLELPQLASILSHLGQQIGFAVHQVSVQKPEDVNDLKRWMNRAVTKGQIDLIMNYSSPVIGRPGAGHFTPIGGYNSKTTEILLSEVNSAFNPSFWVPADLLTQALLGRGYIVIEWPAGLH